MEQATRVAWADAAGSSRPSFFTLWVVEVLLPPLPPPRLLLCPTRQMPVLLLGASRKQRLWPTTRLRPPAQHLLPGMLLSQRRCFGFLPPQWVHQPTLPAAVPHLSPRRAGPGF